MSDNSGFEIVNGILKKYRGNDQNVVIPDSVTVIDRWAFSGCSGLCSVIIPDGVTSIGEYAFSGCGGLTSITIPDSVTGIGWGAFNNCSIKEVHCASLASWLSMIKDNWKCGPFSDATELVLDGVITHQIVIPEGAKCIPNKAFEGCGKIASVTIPDSVTSIGKRAFCGCSSLTSITIPKSVIHIDDLAFNGCSIKEVHCASLASWLSMKKEYWSVNPFSDATELVLDGVITHEIVIPEGTKEIPKKAFWGCCQIVSVKVPDGVTGIGNRAFNLCSNLTSIILPDSITSIGNGAFSGCSSLTGIILPDSVIRIGEYAFSGCSSLTDIILPNGVASIGEHAFSGCSSLTGIILPDSVTSIDEGAFSHCSSLTGITILNGLTSIGEYAFDGCSSLTSITIPESVIRIGKYAFSDCSSLNGITIPDSITSIDEYTFSDCSSLTSVILPDSVTIIGKYAFSGCNSLTGITIPDSVTSIDEYAFSGCSSLTGITIPDSVTFIGSKVFDGCCIKEVRCANLASWLSMNKRAWRSSPFGDTTELVLDGVIMRQIVIPDGTKEIPYKAFFKCGKITNVTIPDSVNSIGDYAFFNCRGLTSITIPDGVTSIGQWAFSGCSGLASITIPDSVTSIGYDAFNGVKTVVFSGACLNLCFGISFDSQTKVLFPADTFAVKEKLPTELAALNLSLSTKEIAYIFLYQKAKSWISFAEKNTTDHNKVFAEMLEAVRPAKKASLSGLAAYMLDHSKVLNAELFREAVALLRVKGYKQIPDLEIPGISGQTDDAAYAEHPIEGYARECIETRPIDPIAMKAAAGMKVCYADRRSYCSSETLAYVISEWLNSSSSNLSFDGIECIRNAGHEKSDRIVEALDRDDFSKALSSLVDGGKPNYRYFLPAWGRYATANDVTKTRKNANDTAQNNFAAALLLNDSIAAVALFYFQIRRTTALPCTTHDEHGLEVTKTKPSAGQIYCQQHGISVHDLKKILTEAYMDLQIHQKADSAVCDPSRLISMVLNYENAERPLEEEDAFAKTLKADELRKSLDAFAKLTDYSVGCRAWARFANGEQIEEALRYRISTSRGKPVFSRYGEEIYKALFLSDEIAAMKLFDKYGALDQYAAMRGISAMEARDSIMLPDFGFDADGVKRYGIGGNTVEVSITPDLSFQLFDVDKQKEIRSFPKKSDDPQKAETCANDYAAFKKEVQAFARERTALLHRMHMSGEYIRPDLWRKVYVDHEVIRHLAQLVVWQDQSGKTFTVSNGQVLDQRKDPYEPQGRIRIAHVLDLTADEIEAWQRRFAEEGLKQPFEQIWEPIIDWQTDGVRSRYTGARLTKAERSALKKALALRGITVQSDEMGRKYDSHTGTYLFDNENDMHLGSCLTVHYHVDQKTEDITFDKARTPINPNKREMNAVLLETDKATISHHVARDHDTVLTDVRLSGFTAAQITALLALAIDRKAARCTALLLNYKNEHYPQFAEVEEFTLDW